MLIVYALIVVVILIVLGELLISHSVHKDMTKQEGLPIVESDFETFKELFDKHEADFEYYQRWKYSLFVYDNYLMPHPDVEIHASRVIFNGEAYKFGFWDWFKVQGYVRNYINNNKLELLNRERKLFK